MAAAALLARYGFIYLDSICKNITPNAKPGRKRKQKGGLSKQADSPARGTFDPRAQSVLETTPKGDDGMDMDRRCSATQAALPA